MGSTFGGSEILGTCCWTRARRRSVRACAHPSHRWGRMVAVLLVVTALTWLLAPFGGAMVIAVPMVIAFLSSSAGYNELAPLAAFMVMIVVLWSCLAWAIAQLRQGRARQIHIAVSVGLALVGAAFSLLPATLTHRSVEQVTVTTILPTAKPTP